MSRVTEKGIERLQKAQQSMDLIIKDVARMNERLKHLIEIADADVHQRKPRM